MVAITFHPDLIVPEASTSIETALVIGIRANPALESTQLRWQVKVGPHDTVQLESGGLSLEQLGGALFLTTKEPPPDILPDEPLQHVGWIKWIAERGRQSFQIQLAISRIAFDRVCHLAEMGRYPNAMLTFEDDGPIEISISPHRETKIWNNVKSNFATIREFTLKYDLSNRAYPAERQADIRHAGG
jgi:hypothetical protein